MRVIDTHTGQFKDIDPETDDYAILSHTWDKDGEQTYEQLKKIQERYLCGSRDPQSFSNVVERESTTIPNLVQTLPEALGRLTKLEVDALLRLVAETFGLTPATTDTSTPSDSSSAGLSPHCSTTPSPQSTIWDDPELSPKIREACRVARKNAFRYIWIDSCCIDKSSSSELSEAINSMYKWYGLAAVCYAYLADVPPGEDHEAKGSAFCRSRWFRRGWTLQELVAPGSMEFLSKDWAPIGSKHTLVHLIKEVTNINEEALLHLEPLGAFSVAQRLSWAAERETTRIEDRAYSLLGIFDINMSTLYGEGDRAFRRLQEQIMQCIPDHSLFVWEDIYLSSQLFQMNDHTATPKALHIEVERYPTQTSNFLATSPDAFKGCNHIRMPQPDAIQLQLSHLEQMEYTFTPHGIRTQFPMIPLTRDLLLHALPCTKGVSLVFEGPKENSWYLAILRCEHADLPGHLLGRVCYISPSKSGVQFVRTGVIGVKWTVEGGYWFPALDLLPLSPETINYCSQRTEIKTVYLLHPDRTTEPASLSLRWKPYTAIKLVLSRETHNALRSRGYSADLRHPDPDHLTTHWLTLSNNKHIITIEFQHTLNNGGRLFTIKAEVKLSGFHVQSNSSALDSEQVERHTMSWSDYIYLEYFWVTKLEHRRVELSAAGPKALTVDLGLDFGGYGYYFLYINILGEELPASPDVELLENEEEEEMDDAEDFLSETSSTHEHIGREEARRGNMIRWKSKMQRILAKTL